MFHKITSLQTKDNYILIAGFANNKVKAFDLKPYIDKYKPFKQFLTQPDLFEKAKIDIGGYGVVWNDELDVSADGIYEKGVDYSIDSEADQISKDLLTKYIELRRDLHISQKQLENVTKIQQSSIARLETMNIDTKISTLSKLLVAMGYTLKIEKL